MALDKIIDSAKLDIGLSDTAGLLGEFFAALCGDSSIPTFDWEVERVAVQGAGTTAAGFAKDIYEYLAAHYSGGGGGTTPTLDGRKVTMGTFSFSSNSTSSKTITHGLGEAPEIIAVFSEGLSSSITSHIPYANYDSVRGYYFRYNSSGSLLASSSVLSSFSPTSETFTIPTGGYHFTAGVQYFWVALGAKSAGGGA